jgi:hypothetical protein
MAPIFSSSELRSVAEKIRKGIQEAEISPDLGLTRCRVRLFQEGFSINDTQIAIPRIRDNDKSCYILVNGKLQKLQFAAGEKVYKLIPTSNRPILQISGTSMHKKEFIERIRRDRLKGKILDAGTGLGYTAIAAAKTADQVITVEIDPNVTEIAKLNSYSKELFESSRIIQINSDITEEIKKFQDREFDFIILDGGTAKGSAEFFSLSNYVQAHRVLKDRGRLYHYVPKPQFHSGRDFASEVAARLKKAGFKKIKRYDLSSYLCAEKKIKCL